MKKNILKVLSLIICITIFMAFTSCQIINKKPTKETFFEAHSNLLSLEKEQSNKHVLLQNFEDAVLNDSFNSSGSMKIGIDIPEELLYGSNIELIQEILDKSEINYNTSVDNEDKKTFSELGLSYADAELLKLSLFASEDEIDLKIPLINEKYFSIDLQQIDKVFENFGIEVPEIDFSSMNFKQKYNDIKNSYNDLKIGLEKIKNDYISFSEEYFDEDAFEFDSDKVMVGTKEVKCDTIALTITPDMFKGYIEQLNDKIQNDDDLQDFIVEDFGDLLDSFSSFGSVYKDSFENSLNLNTELDSDYKLKDEIKENYSSFLETLKEDLNELELSDNVSIKTYVDNKENIVKEIIDFSLNIEGENIPFTVEFGDYTVDENNSHNYFSIEGEDTEGSKVNILFDSLKEEKEKGYVQSLKFVFEGMDSGEEIESVTFDMQIDSTPDDKDKDLIEFSGNFSIADTFDMEISGDGTKVISSDKELLDINYSVSIIDGYSQEYIISGNMLQEVEGSVKDTISSNFSLEAGIEYEGQRVAFNFSNKADYEFGKADIPAIATEDKINLAEVDEEALNEISQEALQNIQFFVMSNQDILQLLYGF